VAEDSPAYLQSQLAGGVRIYVQCAASTMDLSASLKALADVSSVVPGEEAGSVILTASSGRDIRSQVAKHLVDAGIDLLELRQMGVSLEQIFLQLTKDDAADETEND
jgi:ABC-2 type transport system ATP-binding protein